MPSPADVRLMKRVVKGARILGVGFLDHIIVGRRNREAAWVFQFSGSRIAVRRFKRFARWGREQRQGRRYALVAESWRERRTSDPQNKGVVARR
jgi:RadC-like JAB domain-containing protein